MLWAACAELMGTGKHLQRWEGELLLMVHTSALPSVQAN